MDRFSSISLFDFFSFVIPGVVLEIFFYSLYKLSGASLPADISFLHEREVILLLLLTTGGYLLGHVIHFTGNRVSWLGVSAVRRKNDWFNYIKKHEQLKKTLATRCREHFGFSITDAEGELQYKQTNEFFDISFRLMESNTSLQTVRTLQVQFILFSNMFTTALLGAVIFLLFYILTLAGVVNPVNSLSFLITGIVLVIAAFLFLAIAKQRRQQFIHHAWWQIYTIFHPLKNENSGHEQNR